MLPLSNQDKEKNNKLKSYSNLLELSSIGLNLVVSIFIGLFIGLFFDKIFKTKPLLTIVFLLMGIIAGFVNIFRIANSFRKK